MEGTFKESEPCDRIVQVQIGRRDTDYELMKGRKDEMANSFGGGRVSVA